MTPKRPIGIDLGTTYSVAAWLDETGRTAVINSSEGDLLTPSVVVFEDDRIVVGKEAKKLGVLKPGRVAECVKRDMGNPFYSRAIDDEYLPPEVIQACILKKLRQDITTRVGPDFGVVITVPAFFDEPRRRATAMAGEIAGLHILDIVNEPVAAALAFDEHLASLRSDEEDSQPVHVLVYDLGGGTFDTSMLRISQVSFRTVATDGDVRLGGRDWDMRLADLACEGFVKRYREDPRENPVSFQRLLKEVEHAKHTLSARQRANVRIDHTGSSLETEVTREAFEERTADLLERTSHTTKELLRSAGMEWTDVTRILLAGGSTRMPMVVRRLKEESGITPDSFVSPDEVVARGAAIYAKHLLDLKSDQPPNFTITHVNSHNLGIQGVECDTGQKVNAVLIPRNTLLPADATRTFVTRKKNQREIAILVLEGESSIPSECTIIGRAVVKDLPANLPAGYPVEVTYEYARNSRLHVHARVPDVERELDIDIERGARLPDEWISDWQEVVCSDVGWPAYRDLLEQQRSRDDGVWRQLSARETRSGPNEVAIEEGICVEFDEVVVRSGDTDDAAKWPDDERLELERTVQTVRRRPTDETDRSVEDYGSMESVYAPSVTESLKQQRQKQIMDYVWIISAGIVALLLFVSLIWWLFGARLWVGPPPPIPRLSDTVAPSRNDPSPEPDGEESNKGKVQTNDETSRLQESQVSPDNPIEIDLTRDLELVRSLLTKRRIIAAQQHLDKVSKDYKHSDVLDAYDRWMLLNRTFWLEVSEAMKAYQGRELQVGNDYVRVLEVESNKITIFDDARHHPYTLRDWRYQEKPELTDDRNSQGTISDDMPRELVLAFYEIRFFRRPGYSEILKGCFLAAEGATEEAIQTLRNAKTKSKKYGKIIDSILRYTLEVR